MRLEAAQKHCQKHYFKEEVKGKWGWRLPKSIGFYREKKAWFPSPGPPKSIQNQPQTYKNAKVEAKSSWKTSREGAETDFAP